MYINVVVLLCVVRALCKLAVTVLHYTGVLSQFMLDPSRDFARSLLEKIESLLEVLGNAM